MVKIKNYLTNRFYRCHINRKIENLLKYVPQNDLVGIEKIVVYNTFSKKSAEYAGLYRGRDEKELASIEIALNSVFFCKTPVLMFVPFVGRFLLASVLYHEIGHHCHHSFKHGIKKSKREIFANKYKKETLQKALWGWRLLLSPLTPFVKHMAKKN